MSDWYDMTKPDAIERTSARTTKKSAIPCRAGASGSARAMGPTAHCPLRRSLRVLGNQCTGLRGQLGAIDVLALHLVDPVCLHGASGATPALGLGHVQRHDAVAGLLGDCAAHLVAFVHGPAEHGRGLDARAVVDHLLQVGGEL